MNKSTKVSVLVLVVISLSIAAAGPSLAVGITGKDYIDDLIHQYNPQGAAIVLIDDGVISDVRNYGYANIAHKTAVTDETQFKIASISKTVTAYAVMKLVDEGKLDLDTSIDTYFTRWHLPGSALDAGKVTLRTLLSHTSGVTGSDELGYNEPFPSIDEALKMRNTRLKRVPGTKFEYSDFTGYGICQLIIEEVTNTKYEEYMVNHIFKPLGMNHTNYDDGKSSSFATPYAGAGEPVQITPIVMNGSGGVSSTAADMARFAIELMHYYNTGNKEMFKPQKNTESSAGVYALGIIPRDLKNGKIVYEHNGTLTGWNAQLAFEPVSGKGMVILTNSDKSYYLTYDLMEKWSDHTLGEKAIDNVMNQVKNIVSYSILALAALLLVLLAATVIKLKKWTIILREKRITRYLVSSGIVITLAALYYTVLYTSLPVKILFNMDNYYGFTFFPPFFRWVNVVLVLIAALVVFRSGYRRNKHKTCSSSTR